MTKIRTAKCIVIAILTGALLFSNALRAQEEADVANRSESELALKTDRIVVFKDGYCLVIKSATAKTDARGDVFTEQVPDAAVLGSFWAIADTGTLRSMKAGWIEDESVTTRDKQCQQTIEIIRANIGKECSFLVDDKTRLSGVIVAALTNPTDVAVAATRELLGPSFSLADSGSIPQPIFAGVQQVGDQFVLRTDDGDMLIHASQIRQLVIADMTTTIKETITKISSRKRLTLKFAEANEDVSLKMIYFRPGVRWIPTYRIDLAADAARADEVAAKHQGDEKADGQEAANKKYAEISLQGELINEAEDLIDMPIDVVVGVPNFRFRDVPSPMVLESVMRNALSNGQAGFDLNSLNSQSLSNAMYTQRTSEFRSGRATGGQPGSELQLPEDLTGSAGNDLFVYSLPAMSLKKGERATVPIMNTIVPYRDIFTWDVQLKHSETYVAPGTASQSPLVLSENTVWRQVELINDTKFPWTTGAAMFVEGFQPLAQELLTYTSPGGICRVPVTVAVDLRGKVEDSETSRKPEDMTWRGYQYARINGRAEVELANNKEQPVNVEIRLTLGGKAQEVSDDGKLRLSPFRNEDWESYSGERAVNNSSSILWKTTVEPGECFKPTVDYHFFLRH